MVRQCEYFRQVSEERIKEIDRIRASGGKTELEIWWNSFNKNQGGSCKNKNGIKISVFNIKTKEEKEYTSIKHACKDNGVNYTNVRNKLKKSESNKILYKGFIFKKIVNKIDTGQKINRDNHLKSWKEEDIAYMVQRRPVVPWKSIAVVIGKTAEACSEKYRSIKKEGQLEHYMNYELESIKW